MFFYSSGRRAGTWENVVPRASLLVIRGAGAGELAPVRTP
jgi:hypothetical protein